jgi:hypothetical protein
MRSYQLLDGKMWVFIVFYWGFDMFLFVVMGYIWGFDGFLWGLIIWDFTPSGNLT